MPDFSLGGVTYSSFADMEIADLPPSIALDQFSRVGQGVKPKDFAYIRVLDHDSNELDIIYFQFMPRMITDAKMAQYQDIHILGRSSPFKTYSGSSARGISFSLDFFTNPELGDTSMGPEVIKTYIDRLQALLHPIYDKYWSVTPPPRCLVHVGDQIEMIGVCTHVSVSYDNQRIPWTGPKRQGIYAFGASVQLTFSEVQEIPLDYDIVKSAGKVSSASKYADQDSKKQPPLPEDVYVPEFFDPNNPYDTNNSNITGTVIGSPYGPSTDTGTQYSPVPIVIAPPPGSGVLLG